MESSDKISIAKKYGLEPPVDAAFPAPANAGSCCFSRVPVSKGSRVLSITPHKGIGPVKLGMSSEEILAAIRQLHAALGLPATEIQISRDIQDYGYALRYISPFSFFLIQYENDQAAEIAINQTISEYAVVRLLGLDCFQMPAEDLVNALKQYSVFSCDWEDEQLATEYLFEEIGVRLWRERAYHPKLLSHAAYMKEMANVIEEELQYLYIQLVAIKR